MPTWRRQLVGDAMRPGGAHVAHPGFFESPYATNWLELLRSERLSELAERAGLSIAFVPHPNSIEFLTRPLPAHVEAYRYQDADIQELFARGAVMITDYSSNAFELAYLNRPVDLLPVRPGGLLLRPARLPPRRMELRDRRLRSRRRALVPGPRRAGVAHRSRAEARRTVRRANGAGVRVPRREMLRAGLRVDPLDATPAVGAPVSYPSAIPDESTSVEGASTRPRRSSRKFSAKWACFELRQPSSSSAIGPTAPIASK